MLYSMDTKTIRVSEEVWGTLREKAFKKKITIKQLVEAWAVRIK